MRLLITRPADDARSLADELAARGIDSVIAPVMTVADATGPAPDLAGVQAVLITSANGVRALARMCETREVPVLAVGDASAAAARDLGFQSVTSAGGDVAALAKLTADSLDPANGALLHVAGSSVAGDLRGDLTRAGFDCRRAVLYEARPVDSLGAEARDALSKGEIDGVLLYSPRTAKTFAAIVHKDGVAGACARLTAYCLSPAVADAVQGLRWRRVVVAAAPDQDSLLAAVDAAGKEK